MPGHIWHTAVLSRQLIPHFVDSIVLHVDSTDQQIV